MKNKKLISQFKQLRKSLDIMKGHKLQLYKTDYTVMETNDKFTFLKDPNGNPVAFETKKLKQILTKCATDSIKKAVVSDKNPAIVHGSEKGASDRTKASVGMGSSPGKMHGGMIRVDKVDSKGNKYHYWVHAVHGTKHEQPSESSPKKETELHEADQKLHSQLVTAIHKYASPGDVKDLTEKLGEWIEAKANHSNLKEAHNQLAKETGGVTSSTVNHVASKQSDHEKKFQAFKAALAQSAEKRMKNG
jgi:hypothetical protein